MTRFTIFTLTILLAACSGGGPAGPGPEELVGTWRAVLTSPGGELPFTLEIEETADGLAAVARNGGEEAPFSSVSVAGEYVVFSFDWYDSEIRSLLVAPDRLSGEWTKTLPAGVTRMRFEATRGDERRFLPVTGAAPGDETPAPASIDGHWAVEFTDGDGTEPARGEFRQEGNRVLGTFLTAVGDYRFLEGSFEGGRLRLSTFDGGHAFLFQAELGADGGLKGDFWSRETYHATWRARRAEAGEQIIPDAWSLVGLTNDEGRFRFSFPDLEGSTVSLEDARFDGKVVLVNIFGSWCPNCNDEAPLLAEWYRRYRDRGLEIVGLAYEFTGHAGRDRRQVRRFAERHGIEYPLLLAGVSDKSRAAQTLPDLTAVLAYPTTIFIDRDGKVRKIHSGFSGPGTGAHYEELVAELEGTIEELLGE